MKNLAQQGLPDGVYCSSCISGESCSLLGHFPPLNSCNDLWFAAFQARTSQSPFIALSWAHLHCVSAVATRKSRTHPSPRMFNKKKGDNEQLFRSTTTDSGPDHHKINARKNGKSRPNPSSREGSKHFYPYLLSSHYSTCWNISSSNCF